MKSLTRFNSLFFTTAFCFFLVSPCRLGVVNSVAAAEKYPDRLELFAMAKNGQFAKLDARLSGYQESFEAGRLSDRIVGFAFETFASSDPVLQTKLSEWIKRMPNSYAALLARGMYYENLGWISRGAMLAKDTSDARFEKMRKYFQLAITDFARAVEINNKMSVAYANLIDIAMASSGRRMIEVLLQAGLRAVPNSVIIRYSYINTLQPWWGGSIAEIEVFLDETKRQYPDDKELNILQGYYDLTKGEQLKRAGKAREAIDYFDRAVGYGLRGLYFVERGRNYYRLKQYRKALDDFNRALQVWPQTASFLNYRAKTLRKLGRYDGAFRDWGLAVKLDPLDPDILLQVAYALRDRRFYDQALAALNNALHYGANDYYIRDARGRLYLYELSDPIKAVEDLEVATQLRPGSTRSMYNYALALYKSHNCRAVKAIRKFRKTCRKGMPSCRSKNLTWARNALKYLTTTGGCAR